jgi:hypothetical protein
MRLADFSLQCVLQERSFDPRYQIAAIGLVIYMLELAPTAFGKMSARRLLVMRPRRERSVVEESVARHTERHMTPA